MKKVLLGFAALVSIAYARLFGGPMDGTAWDVKLKPDTFFARSKNDTLIFQNGKMTMAGFLNSGFSAASYTTQEGSGGEQTLWSASLKGADNGLISLTGLTQGERIEGMALWMTQAGRSKIYTFQGKRKS